MQKLIKSLKWIDDNLVHVATIAFIFLTNLVPKYPISFVEYTYIRIRIDDVLPVILVAIFFLQLIRRKVSLNIRVLVPIVMFWVAVFASFIYNHYVTSPSTVPIFNIGFLHSARRIQYMAVFFVASSVVVSEKRFMQYLKYYFITLTIVGLYGLGQKFLAFPSIQSMNPAYTDGRLLFLNASDRISTFPFLLLMRKFRVFCIAIGITAVLLLVTGDMTKRFLQTFQVKTVFVNEQTGGTSVDQKITVKNLPAGTKAFKLPFGNDTLPTPTVTEKNLKLEAQRQIYENAKRKGIYLSKEQIEAQSDELAKLIKPKQMLLCDISCATRLEVEWPRAIVAFKSNPLIGTGPSSITEATDNDILRWLGETGLVGTLLFVTILFLISRYAFKLAHIDHEKRYLHYGFIFGVIALLVNALYVDIFEASKMAYNFWIMSGMIVGYYTFYEKRKKKT
ncbi:hypothetical protein HYS00_03110 [Candidatus Microgenomates bacterium]|nr:hypothetical protein [Candidatus Microgenomates bacterium]